MLGPDMVYSVRRILLRFLSDEEAMTADIEQMFYCFEWQKHHNFCDFTGTKTTYLMINS